ncbi:hypothetical protein L2E82_50905 [Cichorium intybus]|nr:hypothetical protein L2E82_50905 [Cichorium intybus]
MRNHLTLLRDKGGIRDGWVWFSITGDENAEENETTGAVDDLIVPIKKMGSHEIVNFGDDLFFDDCGLTSDNNAPLMFLDLSRKSLKPQEFEKSFKGLLQSYSKMREKLLQKVPEISSIHPIYTKLLFEINSPS